MSLTSLREQILAAEQALLHGDPADRLAEFEKMLAADFREFNPEGRVSERADVLAWLTAKDPAARWEFRDFEVLALAEGLALATYHAHRISSTPSNGALHSSIWQWSEEAACWQLLFHQSSKCVQI